MPEHYEATVYLNGTGNAPNPDLEMPPEVTFDMMAELVNVWLAAAVESEAIRQKYGVAPDDMIASLNEGPTLTDLYVSTMGGIHSVTPEFLKEQAEVQLAALKAQQGT
jgi:hypothetical protein